MIDKIQICSVVGCSRLAKSLVLILLLSLSSDVLLDAYERISDVAVASFEMSDAKDAESSETWDAEEKDKVQPAHLNFFLGDCITCHSDWSSSSYFSMLFEEILTPPPEVICLA